MSENTGHRRFKKNPWNFIAEDQTKMPQDHEDFLRRLGQVIRKARKNRKMTQEDLSEIALVNAKYLGEVERGKTNPTITLLVKLSSGLEMEIWDVLLATRNPEKESIYTEIFALLRRLDGADLNKLHKILQLIVQERRP